MIWKFAPHSTAPKPSPGNLWVDILTKMEEGNRIMAEEAALVSGLSDSVCVPNGCIATLGWCIDFRPYLK